MAYQLCPLNAASLRVQVIFFVRIFADVLGRFLPRLRPLVAESPLTPLALACGKLATVPVFLLYLRSPPRWHSDVAAVAFVAMLWTAGGYVNTMSNMLAPKLVPPQVGVGGADAGAADVLRCMAGRGMLAYMCL